MYNYINLRGMICGPSETDLGLDLDLGLLITSDLLFGWCWCCYNLPNLR